MTHLGLKQWKHIMCAEARKERAQDSKGGYIA